MQLEIKAKQKLANAEKRANENTLQLIKSMDKFKATTVTAVSARSMEAQKLQSRSFTTPAKVQPVTTAQQGLGQSQKELSDRYTRLTQMIDAYQREARAREDDAKEELKRLNKAALDIVHQIASAFDADKLAVPLKSLEKMVKNIGVVSY